MRRGKPPQELYTPGSFNKLRRSNQGTEDTLCDPGGVNVPQNNFAPTGELTATTQKSSNQDQQKRPKKPERELYVVKPAAHAREQLNSSNFQNQNFGQETGALNDSNPQNDRMRRSKTYSNTRINHDNNSGKGNSEWRDKSPNRNNYRMGSEPRGGSNGPGWYSDRHRERDTRSVEPTGVGYRNNNPDGGRIQSKPPSGRRHSTTGTYFYNDQDKRKNFQKLPPRLKKKFINESGLTAEECAWLDDSISYPDNVQPQHQQDSYNPVDSYNTLPHSTASSHYSNFSVGSHTLPSRPRGRGRFHHPDSEFKPGPAFRSVTPDIPNTHRSPANSRPGTPTKRFDNRPPSRPPSCSQTPLGHYEDNKYSNDSCGDNRGAKHIAYDEPSRGANKWGSRASEPRHLESRDDSSQQESVQRKSANNRNNTRGNIRNDGRDDTRNNRQRYNDKKDERRKRNNSERRTSIRDFGRNDTKESLIISNDSNKTATSEYEDENKMPQPTSFDPTCFEEVKSNSGEPLVETNYEVNTVILSGNRDYLDWNEEVELNHRLEAEASHDTITGSSSLTSLQEISTKSIASTLASTDTPSSKKRMPFDEGPNGNGRRRTRSSRNHRDLSFDSFRNKSQGPSRDASFDRNQENWRDEIIRSRQNSEREGSSMSRRLSKDRSRKNSEYEDQIVETPSKKGGILASTSNSPEPTLPHTDRPVFPDLDMKETQYKTLFDPKNPNKPILVKSPGNRIAVAVPGFSESNLLTPKLHATDSSGKAIPTWYNESSEDFQSSHFPDLLRDIKRADAELQVILSSGLLLVNYEFVDNLRQFLKSALEFLVCKAIKFCQITNVEQHIWKMLYYNIIEITRKAILEDPDNKEQYKGFLLFLIDEGMTFFENLTATLEDTYNFKIVDYIGNNSMAQPKGLGFTKLALVSTQKIFLFIGDLGRYREQVNETANYGKCRQWYIKSHEINPKNGKPYNQLAVLAVYSKRKLDAVYYYMRSLMSSNPVQSASESLSCLFYENRKRYEQNEKRRREERLERHRQHMKEKESAKQGTLNFLRKETWILPDGSRRQHRTSQAFQEEMQDSEEEDLASLSSVNVNKRFITSYLHVHGKLITKIGLDSFHDSAMQMLKEFRALLQHSPVPLPCNRFLQLLALNMFTIESTQLKDPSLNCSPTYRSELQERALIISLQMFNLILEQCVCILQAHFYACLCDNKSKSPLDTLPHDANVLLPAVKVWCDWMLCHASVWNPPPNTGDFKLGSSGDLWSRLGLLMNILAQLHPDSLDIFVNEPREGYELVRLPEDATLSGFTPLFHDREAFFAPSDLDPETAQLRLRISKLLFFGTVYLCGLEPPVLKLEIVDGRKEYVSVVDCSSSCPESPIEQALLKRHSEILLETFSGDEEETVGSELTEKEATSSLADSFAVEDLLNRKVELEEKNKNQELHLHQVMKILSQSIVSVYLEIRPKYLVPDTNCFVDHLGIIRTLAKSNLFTFMVPIVVLSELEGLSKGVPLFAQDKMNPEVPEASRRALEFLKIRHASVKCVTTNGAILSTTNFTTEESDSWDGTTKNDDKILTTCLILCKDHVKEEQNVTARAGEPRHLFRDVVLLTDDRNLRVKAHARDLPVRSPPDFMHWAGVGD
ncbi:unnamed protein product [Ceutorhynchus assimilis]|uniref:PIN domain-containing protein n=1 Tax=Ceutorhynchus assimilis TaxID=467358 RepID=A0A9P0DKR7_9CUCU|nr:unnamed protein product [Ceutorhynchus assimilis]